MQISDQGELIELSGDVLLHLENFTLFAQNVQIHGQENRTLRAQVDVKINRTSSLQQELTSNELYYSKINGGELQAWGNVQFIDEGQGITVNSSSLTLIENKKQWYFEGNVEMIGKDFNTQSLLAIYYEETQILELYGNAYLIYEGQKFEAEQIIFDIQTKELSMEQLKHGSITLNTTT